MDTNIPLVVENIRLIAERLTPAKVASMKVTQSIKTPAFEYRAERPETTEPPMAVLISTEDGIAAAVILLIIVSDPDVHLLSRVHPTTYSTHYCSWLLSDNSTVDLLCVKDLKHPQPLHVYEHEVLGKCVIDAYEREIVRDRL